MKTMNKKYIIYMLLLIILLITTNIVYVSAYNNINFKNITSEDGLSQGTVETIIQDDQGYIWLGTNDGLCRYNGYEFKIYKHDEELENSITNNYIVDINQDNLGNIWVGTANGLSKIDTKTDLITNYNMNDEEKSLSHYNIGDILITKSGDVLVGTSDGLNIYNEKKDEFYRIFNKDSDLSSQFIRSLAEDENQNIWVATNNGIDKIDIKNNKNIISFKTGHGKFDISENDIYVVRYDPKGYIWAGALKEGLNRIDINTNEVKQYKNDYRDEKSLPGNYVKDILRDSSGNLWVGTDNGLAKYNEQTENFATYKNKIYDKTSLVNDEVFSIQEDESGLIWVGTYAGISMFDPNTNIEHYKKDPFDENSISDNSIHGIYEDKDGLLWVGTNSKGVNVINRKNYNVKHLNKTSKDYPISDDNINDIVGIDNKIFIATKNGLNEVDKDLKTINIYNTEDGICNNNITALFADSKKNVWIGTANGISVLNTNTNEIIDITDILTNHNIEDQYIKVIYEDRKGNYWVGCFIDGGLVKIDPNKRTIENYRNKKEDKTSISSNNIRSIVEDKNGNLYIGTSYGLNKLNESNNTFERYSEKDGLSNNTVYGLLVDDNNNLWASTNLGISKLDTNTMTFETFNIIDGFQGNEFNGRAYYKNNSGELFFGGINGLNIFRPNDINRSRYVPTVIFDEFKVNGKVYKDINNQEFKYNENTINISVFISNYKNTKNIQYMYKLEGVSDSWDISRSNNINYSDLAPGTYTLKIKARSYSGKVSDESAVKFIIKPPIWKSKAAILIYLIIITIVIYRTINSVKRLDNLVKNKTLQLTKEMEKNDKLLKKVIELEKRKNNYFVNLSHELRTPLNVISSTEQLVTELNKSKDGIGKSKLNGCMQVVRRNTNRLLNLINNIIDTAKIESGSYQLNIREHDIVYIVEEATLSLKDYIERKGIELIIDPEMEEKIIKCDEHEIERCIVNLVSNAAKFTPEGGTIEVTIEDLDEKVKIIVKDTGIGIDKKYHDSIFNRFNQVIDQGAESEGGSGLGLTITKQIIDMHGGQISVESELGKGCKFIIILEQK
ncbi:ligand-binding sensor domain-containing protein [Romboutsia timonensis]|uniref:ligand-binding sensor domain-containing protein n=1 Tax=Romboutsia timonensis TaxID=1776391 RepID=UPI0008D8E493|nr:sensor histidine kinase [Romboutsia timonensis]